MLEIKTPKKWIIFAVLLALTSASLAMSCDTIGEKKDKEPIEHSDIFFAFDNQSTASLSDITVKTGTTTIVFADLDVGRRGEYQKIPGLDMTKLESSTSI